MKEIAIDFETAKLVRAAFIPHNPRKMRNCDEAVRQAALRFIEAVEQAEKAPCGAVNRPYNVRCSLPSGHVGLHHGEDERKYVLIEMAYEPKRPSKWAEWVIAVPLAVESRTQFFGTITELGVEPSVRR